MAEVQLFPQPEGEQPSLLPENNLEIPDYPEGVLQILDATVTEPSQTAEGQLRPGVLRMRQIWHAASISKEVATTAQRHRMFQQIFTNGYLRLKDGANHPSLTPEEAATLREQAVELESLKYYHLHESVPEERSNHIREMDWPEPTEGAA